MVGNLFKQISQGVLTSVRPDNRLLSSQAGAMMAAAAIVAMGILAMFGLTYDVYRILREQSEQDRIARSVGIVTLKAFASAGCEFDWKNGNRKRIEYALKAAAEVVDVEGASWSSVSPLVTSPTGAVEQSFSDDTGPTRGFIQIKLGSLTSLSSTAALGAPQACQALPPPNGNPLGGIDDFGSNLGTPQVTMIPEGFNWLNYIARNWDFWRPNLGIRIDTELEAKRHFSGWGFGALRQGINPVFSEPHRYYAVDVTVNGLSSFTRTAGFSKMFGVGSLPRRARSIRVVYDTAPAQPLQVEQIEIASNPPQFKAPKIDTNKPVEYTMSMDIRVADTQTGWRNIFASSTTEVLINGQKWEFGGPMHRRPALFIWGGPEEDLVGYPVNTLGLVHGSTTDSNSFVYLGPAPIGQWFNLTWKIRNGELRAFIDGNLDPQGSLTRPFNWGWSSSPAALPQIFHPMGTMTASTNWGEQQWAWNSYLAQERVINSGSSMKVRNVFWWNRALGDSEIASVSANKPSAKDRPYRIFDGRQ